MKKNEFWVVYDNKNKIVVIEQGNIFAKIETLNKSKYRWTLQTFERDWGYLLNDGYTIKKGVIKLETSNCNKNRTGK